VLQDDGPLCLSIESIIYKLTGGDIMYDRPQLRRALRVVHRVPGVHDVVTGGATACAVVLFDS